MTAAPKQTLRIALANLRAGATLDESVRLACDAICEAGREGARVLCFPECYLPGYRVLETPRPPPDAAALEAAWRDVATATREAGITVVLGTERVVDGRARITALVLRPDGEVAGFQDKVQLDPSEDPYFAPGDSRSLFEADGVPFGVVICHEGWRYPETVRALARGGAKVVFHPHYHWPAPGDHRPGEFLDPRSGFHEKAMLCRAAENTIYFASVNCAVEGAQTTSAVINPDGTVRAVQPYGVHGVLFCELDLAAASGHLATRLRT